MNAIKIEQFRPEYPAYFVYTTKVVELWRPDCLFVSKWDGESRTSWFRWSFNSTTGKKREAFCTADVSIAKDEFGYFLAFTNGRHRTRWLLQTKNPVIPMGISNDSIGIAHQIGLLYRKVNDEDCMYSELYSASVSFS